MPVYQEASPLWHCLVLASMLRLQTAWRKDIFADPESQPTLLLTQKHTPAQQTGLIVLR
jgi:ABC-type transport system involved in cytochrome c biogenesis permease component